MSKPLTKEQASAELKKWDEVAKKKQPANYMVILIILLALVYIVDEITSNIASTVQPNVVNEFFVQKQGIDYNTGLSNLSFMSMAGYLITFIVPFYKALADKFGRKKFLAINTIGMGMGMTICMLSSNVIMYIAGVLVASLFTPNDMQVMYIMETASEKHRAKLCSITKACGYLGVTCIPLLRLTLMHNDGNQWRKIYSVPVIMAFVIGAICFAYVRETPVFLAQRSEVLKHTLDEVDESAKKSEGNGGVLNAIKFIAKHKQIRYTAICAFVFAMSIAVTGFYTSIMATNGMDDAMVTKALFAYPIMNALMTFTAGFMEDRMGRKKAALSLALICFVMLILFMVGCGQSWNPYVIGVCYGIFVGAFWSVSDLLFLIIPGESVPTYIRSSVLGTLTLLLFFGGVLSTLIVTIGMRFVTNLDGLCLGVCVPFMALCIIILLTKVHETRGVDMDAITGDEYDN